VNNTIYIAYVWRIGGRDGFLSQLVSLFTQTYDVRRPAQCGSMAGLTTIAKRSTEIACAKTSEPIDSHSRLVLLLLYCANIYIGTVLLWTSHLYFVREDYFVYTLFYFPCDCNRNRCIYIYIYLSDQSQPETIKSNPL